MSDFIIITKAHLYNTSAVSKSKAKQDAVLKSLFITDMRFYKGTTFTFFRMYTLEIPLLGSSVFFYIVKDYFVTVNALYSPENRKITL